MVRTQDRAFTSLKDAITSSEVLAMYDPTLETIVSADASAYGLGAVLRQKQKDCSLHPVAYISRALSAADRTMPKLKKKPLLQPGLVKDFNSTCWVCTSNWKRTTNLLFHCYLQRALTKCQ